jgi:hypothetical protein
MLVQLPNGNDCPPTDVGVLPYYNIRGSKLALDAVVSGLFGVSTPHLPKYFEGVTSRPDIRFIPFAITGFGVLGGDATAFFTDLAREAGASKGMHVGKLLASWRQKFSLAVHVAHVDNVLRGLSAAADGVEAASSSVGMPSRVTVLFTRAMGRKRPLASSRGA